MDSRQRIVEETGCASVFEVGQIGFVNPESEKELKFQQEMRERFPAEAREEALVFKARLSKLKLPTVKEVWCQRRRRTRRLSPCENNCESCWTRVRWQGRQNCDAKSMMRPES
jgi:hypothetical protein